LPLLSPLAAGDQLLVRTYSGVQSVDLETGAVRWQYPSDDDAGNAGLEQSLWSEPAGGAFAADAERFYLLERGTVIADDAAEPAFLSLAACDHFGGREGNLRWRIGGDEGSEPRLAGVRFLGAPVPRNGRLYAIVELKGAIWLMVLAAETGRLQWSQELAVVREEDGTSDFRRMAGAVPSISAEEIIVCPTSGGVVVAVDLTTQELLWAYRYPRKIRGVSDPYRGVRPRMEQDGRWIDAGVTIAADRVLITPPESDEMHCLDLHDGRPLWTRKRGDDLFLACAADGTGLLVGQRQVTAIHLADGRPAWPAPLAIPDEGRPSGRGVFVGAHYFLPLTTCEVVQVSLGGGQIDGRFKSLRESVPGNLVWHNGLFVSQGAEFLEAFDELDALQNRIAGELAVHPEDSGAHLRQGELDLAAGRIESSLSHFRRAYSLSRGSRTRSALAGALLTALRADPAEQAVYSKELDDLLEE
jgi:outer membrane protein assembly factor BamB